MSNNNKSSYPEFVLFIVGICILVAESGRDDSTAKWLKVVAFAMVSTAAACWLLWG